MALTDNLVSWWELDEASGTRNDAHGSNHLTDGNTVAQVAGKVGNAAQFVAANAESLSIADNANLSVSGVFSVCAWVYMDSKINNMCAVSKHSSLFTEYDLYYIADKIEVQIEPAVFISQPMANLSQWYFVAAGWDGTSLWIAIDGGAKATTAGSAPTDSNGAFTIGASKAGAEKCWDGRIDQVGFWKGKTLSASEITFLYNSGAGRSYAAVVAPTPALSDGLGKGKMAIQQRMRRAA